MKEKKYYITLDDFEHRVVVNRMNEMRNSLIEAGKCTDIDEYYLNTERTLDLIRLIDNLHTNGSNKIESSYINAENNRFLDCRESLLLKIDTSERKNFPKQYADIEQYYNGVKQESENLKIQLKNIEKLNIKDLTKIQKSL